MSCLLPPILQDKHDSSPAKAKAVDATEKFFAWLLSADEEEEEEENEEVAEALKDIMKPNNASKLR